MTNKSIWRVVVSGALALLCITLVQSFWLRNTFNLSARAFDEKVRIAIRNVATQLSQMRQVQLPTYHLINQISQDYYVVNIRDAIDANSLEYYLTKELEAVNLFTDFEYGIYDCDTDQMVYGNYLHGQDGKRVSEPTTNLPKYDEFVYYFGVRFPDRKGYLIANQWVPITLTGILLLAMLFFIYATYEIFKQKKLSDLQKDFINNMTHEFKTPLTSIKVSAEVFLQDQYVKKDDRLTRYAKIIANQTTRLNQQVERVLQIADTSANGLELKKEPLAIHAIISKVTDQLKSRLDRRNGQIRLQLNADQDLVSADRLHLANVLFNLLDNALKYTRKAPIIEVTTKLSESNLALKIADNGIGIDDKFLPKIGEKFFRVPTGNVHNAKGFGLGLHYVYQITKAHQWDLQIESVKTQGTTVTLLMPLHHA